MSRNEEFHESKEAHRWPSDSQDGPFTSTLTSPDGGVVHATHKTRTEANEWAKKAAEPILRDPQHRKDSTGGYSTYYHTIYDSNQKDVGGKGYTALDYES